MDDGVQRVLSLLLGLVFAVYGGKFAIDSLGAKDLIASTIFSLLGAVVGLLLIAYGIMGLPSNPSF